MSSKTPTKKPPIDRRTVGLLLIAVLIFVYAVVRWGSTIPWGAR